MPDAVSILVVTHCVGVGKENRRSKLLSDLNTAILLS